MGVLDFICWIFVAIIIMFTVIGYCGMKYDSKDKDKEIEKLKSQNIDLRKQLFEIRRKIKKEITKPKKKEARKK